MPRDTEPARYRGTLKQRVLVVIGSFTLAAVAGLSVQEIVPDRGRDISMLCAVWVALYPIPCLNRRIPWWQHWLQGLLILIAFLAVTRWFAN
jgi:hypothetical protein